MTKRKQFEFVYIRDEALELILSLVKSEVYWVLESQLWEKLSDETYWGLKLELINDIMNRQDYFDEMD